MTNILVYDVEAKQLEETAEKHDMTVAELVEMLCEYLEEVEKEL